MSEQKKTKGSYDRTKYIKYKEYYKNYYSSKPKQEKELVICECGSSVKNLWHHQQSKRHKDIMRIIERTKNEVYAIQIGEIV